MSDVSLLPKLHDDEQWKVIPAFPKYAVSTEGRFASFYWKPFKILKPSLVNYPCGHRRLNVTFDGKTRQASRTVACTFWGTNPKMVLHINGNALDNRLENLKPGDGKENYRDSISHGTAARGEKQGSSKLSAKDVAYIREVGKLGTRGIEGTGNIRVLSDKFGVSGSTIRRIVRGDLWRLK